LSKESKTVLSKSKMQTYWSICQEICYAKM